MEGKLLLVVEKNLGHTDTRCGRLAPPLYRRGHRTVAEFGPVSIQIRESSLH
jgi:hypothetical protein